MLDFKPVRLEDRTWMSPILAESGLIASENAFGTLWIWAETYNNRVALANNTLFVSSGSHQLSYHFPMGGDLKQALTMLLEDSCVRGQRFRLWGANPEQIKQIEEVMPGKFSYRHDRSSSDYIYHSADLIELAGRKFHRKRNHLARFKRAYTYEYEDITPENIAQCVAVERQWLELTESDGPSGLDREDCALKRSLANFQELGFRGGLIRIEGQPVAFTLGEEINPTCFLVHFEKALEGYDGLYTAINQEFAARNLARYQYINREEDLGIEGLRKAKLSYYPALLVEKHVVVLKGDEHYD